jgi:hypothetical protein
MRRKNNNGKGASMQRLATLVVLALSTTAFAQSAQFRVTLTDGRTALHANPRFEELRLSEEQVARAASDRVLMFDRTSNLRWQWLMLSWPRTMKTIEHRLNARGVSASKPDFGVAPIDEKTFTLRCLRDRCVVASTSAAGDPFTKTLQKNETVVARFDSDVRITYEP